MGNMGLPWEKKDDSKSHVVVGLTTLGKAKAEQLGISGPGFVVLDTLNTEGASSVSEIAKRTNMQTPRVQSIVMELLKSGYVKRVSSGE